jgi:Mor family transcriptional regulator
VTVDSVAPRISVGWLSEATLKVKDIVGDTLWKKIVESVGGSSLYIPLESNYYQRRNRKIHLFAQNHTITDTAKHFCLSPRQVKRILAPQAHAER